MKTRILFVLAVLISLVQSSCKKPEWLSEGDYFFFENKGAVMPVWVKGNIESGIFILTNHGGPGWTTGHDFTISVGFQGLEEDYALIYWDQRMSGLAQGDPKKEDMSIDIHIEDLENLVEIIRYTYNPKSFFLMAQSDDKRYWQFIIDWYEENPNPVESDEEPYIYVNALGGYAYDWKNSSAISPIPYIDLVFSSSFTLAFYWAQYNDMPWMDGYDVTQEVGNITIPALLLWGKEDGAVPATVAQFTYDILGTPPEHKEIVLFEKCAHSPHFDTPYKFQEEVTRFVELYK